MFSDSTDRSFLTVGDTCFLPSSGRPYETSALAVPLRSALKCNSATIVANHRLLTGPAGIGIAPSAIAGRVTSGCVMAQGNSCRCRTVMLSLLCLTNWPPSHCRTRGPFTAFCFTRPPSRSSKWQLIPNGWEPGLVFLRSYTLGRSDSNTIRISIVWCRQEECRSMVNDGCRRAKPSSFYPSNRLAGSFAVSSWTIWRTHLQRIA